MSDIQCSVLMAHIQSHEWKFLSPLKMQRTKSSVGSGRRKKRDDYYVHKMMDHTYALLISPTAVCAAHITYQWRGRERLTEVNWQFNFDHTTFLIYIWITLWLHQMTFIPKKKERKGGKRKKKNKVRIHFGWTWKFPLSLRLPCTSIYRLIIQSENENWSLKHLYLNKEREADYECSKCNFYYTSIILLLITDSFSLCSSSKTRLYSIHVHTGAKEKLARLFEMFNLWGGGGWGGGDTSVCWKDMCCRNWSIRFNHNLWNHFNSVCNYSSRMRIIPLSLSFLNHSICEEGPASPFFIFFFVLRAFYRKG